MLLAELVRELRGPRVYGPSPRQVRRILAPLLHRFTAALRPASRLGVEAQLDAAFVFQAWPAERAEALKRLGALVSFARRCSALPPDLLADFATAIEPALGPDVRSLRAARSALEHVSSDLRLQVGVKTRNRGRLPVSQAREQLEIDQLIDEVAAQATSGYSLRVAMEHLGAAQRCIRATPAPIEFGVVLAAVADVLGRRDLEAVRKELRGVSVASWAAARLKGAGVAVDLTDVARRVLACLAPGPPHPMTRIEVAWMVVHLVDRHWPPGVPGRPWDLEAAAARVADAFPWADGSAGLKRPPGAPPGVSHREPYEADDPIAASRAALRALGIDRQTAANATRTRRGR